MSSFDDEYALFKSEIEELDGGSNVSGTRETEHIETQERIDSESNKSIHEEPNNSENTQVSSESIVLPDIENELSYLKGI